MKVKINPKNPRILLDQDGNELLKFTGLHLEDFRLIIARINSYEGKGYSKRNVEI